MTAQRKIQVLTFVRYLGIALSSLGVVIGAALIHPLFLGALGFVLAVISLWKLAGLNTRDVETTNHETEP